MSGFPLPDFDFDDEPTQRIYPRTPGPPFNDDESQELCEKQGLILNSTTPLRWTSNSAVYTAQSPHDGKIWAVKITEHKRRVEAEYQKRLQAPDSPYLVKTISMGQSPTKAMLQMEYCEHGDISNLELEETEIWQLIHDVCRALFELHSHGWMHLDVSPGNILVSNHYKLADFGTLMPIGQFDEGCEGAGPYVSPEALLFPSGPPVGPPTDIFSFGIVLMEVCSNCPAPRGGSNTYRELRKGGLKLGDDPYHPRVSTELTNLVNIMLNPDPGQRPTAEQILAIERVADFEE